MWHSPRRLHSQRSASFHRSIWTPIAAPLDAPIGTGPYVLTEWDKGNQMVMGANPNYWGTPPETDTLVFKWSSEAAQRFLELQSGTVDGIDNPGRDDYATVANDRQLAAQGTRRNRISSISG